MGKIRDCGNLRDLCFHAHEHWYSVPDIAAMVAGAGLRLLCVDASPEAQGRFRALHGAHADIRDPALWDMVEARHPHLFAGMIAVWAQRPGGAAKTERGR
ncbi:MAG: hypothetical protein ACOY45_11885 [Pseudomonadota bacterium]